MNVEKPVFIQIIDMIEDEILAGNYKANDMIISTTEISKLLSVNPTTAVKAVSILTEDGVLYKKRGVGMFVTENAREDIVRRRRELFLKNDIPSLLREAGKLGIHEEELITMIKEHTND